jgi:tetratricopeptide (TPR) repeat protein
MKNRVLNAVLIMMLNFVVVCCAPQHARCESFKDANQLYKDNKYDQAAQAYEKILQTGFESGSLYYNLGNSYFKAGSFGRALLNYERARFFIPSDSDLNSNYNFVRSLLSVPPGANSGKLLFKWLDRLYEGMSINGLTFMLSFLWFSILGMLTAILFIPGIKRYAGIALALFGITLVVSSVSLGRKVSFYDRGAVVIAGDTEAKFEPSVAATTYFKLIEGSSVIVLDRSAGWVKIRRPDAKIGWVPAASIEDIKA